MYSFASILPPRGQQDFYFVAVKRAFYNSCVTYAKALAIFRFPGGARPGPREITARHRELAKRFHPDAGGSQDDMVQVNNARDTLEQALRPRPLGSDYTHAMDEYLKTGQPSETYPEWQKREQRYVRNMQRSRSHARTPE